MLKLCKCQKCKKQINISICRKFNTGDDFKNEKYPEISEATTVYENLHGLKTGRTLMPVHYKILIRSLLNFLFFKSLPVSQFSVLNPQCFSTY